MKSSCKRPFHPPGWERHILFWRSVSAAHASRSGDPAAGCSSDSRDQVSQGQRETASHENGKSWQPQLQHREGPHPAHANVCTAVKPSSPPHCQSGQSVSLEVLQRAKSVGEVCQRGLVGARGAKDWAASQAGVLLEDVSTYFKKREKLPRWHNGRQKRKIWFYATADVS